MTRSNFHTISYTRVYTEALSYWIQGSYRYLQGPSTPAYKYLQSSLQAKTTAFPPGGSQLGSVPVDSLVHQECLMLQELDAATEVVSVLCCHPRGSTKRIQALNQFQPQKIHYNSRVLVSQTCLQNCSKVASGRLDVSVHTCGNSCWRAPVHLTVLAAYVVWRSTSASICNPKKCRIQSQQTSSPFQAPARKRYTRKQYLRCCTRKHLSPSYWGSELGHPSSSDGAEALSQQRTRLRQRQAWRHNAAYSWSCCR